MLNATVGSASFILPVEGSALVPFGARHILRRCEVGPVVREGSGDGGSWRWDKRAIVGFATFQRLHFDPAVEGAPSIRIWELFRISSHPPAFLPLLGSHHGAAASRSFAAFKRVQQVVGPVDVRLHAVTPASVGSISFLRSLHRLVAFESRGGHSFFRLVGAPARRHGACNPTMWDALVRLERIRGPKPEPPHRYLGKDLDVGSKISMRDRDLRGRGSLDPRGNPNAWIRT